MIRTRLITLLAAALLIFIFYAYSEKRIEPASITVDLAKKIAPMKPV